MYNKEYLDDAGGNNIKYSKPDYEDYDNYYDNIKHKKRYKYDSQLNR